MIGLIGKDDNILPLNCQILTADTFYEGVLLVLMLYTSKMQGIFPHLILITEVKYHRQIIFISSVQYLGQALLLSMYLDQIDFACARSCVIGTLVEIFKPVLHLSEIQPCFAAHQMVLELFVLILLSCLGLWVLLVMLGWLVILVRGYFLESVCMDLLVENVRHEYLFQQEMTEICQLAEFRLLSLHLVLRFKFAILHNYPHFILIVLYKLLSLLSVSKANIRRCILELFNKFTHETLQLKLLPRQILQILY